MSRSSRDGALAAAEWLQELHLALSQPLLDWGWRIDFGRKGVTRPGRFIPLDDLKAAAECALSAAGPDGAANDPCRHGPGPDICNLPGEWFDGGPARAP